MQPRHSQALEELFGIRQSIESIVHHAAGPKPLPLRLGADASPAEAGYQPEIFSELCR